MDGSADRRRAVETFAIGAGHELGELGVGESCRDDSRGLPCTRGAPPSLLELFHVVASLGFIGPCLYLSIADFAALDDSSFHTPSVLRNTEQFKGGVPMWCVKRLRAESWLG